MTNPRAGRRSCVTMAMLLVMGGCTAVPTPAPAPAPPPVAAAPRPAPTPPPAAAKPWDERRLDAGEWRYDAGSRTATFVQAGGAAPLVTMACSGAAIDLTAALGAAGQPLGVELRTSAGTDRLQLSGNRTQIPVRDVRLDRIAFSRGRFALEAANGSTLTLPVQSEIGRLIEDCRN